MRLASASVSPASSLRTTMTTQYAGERELGSAA
jgi:hypothetical protein